MVWTTRQGSEYHDVLTSDAKDDMLLGLAGNDLLLDGGRYGQKDNDLFNGGKGNDVIVAHWGVDVLRGDFGNDYLISRSDAGEPDIAQRSGMAKVNASEHLTAVNDMLNGGIGADTFFFRLDLNADKSVLAQHTDMAGNIDWASIVGATGGDHEGMSMGMAMDGMDSMGGMDTMGGGDTSGGGDTMGGDDEMVDPHHYWVEGIGVDTIQDFYRSEGDRIVIEGYSVSAEIRYRDANHDGRNDSTVIRLTSDEGGMGASDGDQLGLIVVYGDFVTAADLQIKSDVYDGVAGSLDDALAWTNRAGTTSSDVLRTTARDDVVGGLAGDDTIVDSSRKGQSDKDILDGGDGNDVIRAHWGSDTLKGGSGDDILVSRCDAGEPNIAQNPSLHKYFPKEPLLQANDVMIGGLGADTFFFRLDLDARAQIAARHTDDSGDISWHGVAGENAAAHLHWVDGIGIDTIRDFYRADGDKIVIEGHTVQAWLSYQDTNGDHRNDMSIITLRSNQGAAGSHNHDYLGMIRVYGNLVTWDDIHVDAGVHHGVANTLDEYTIV